MRFGNIHIDYVVAQRLSDNEITTAHRDWTYMREAWNEPMTLTWTFEEQAPEGQIVEGTAQVLPLDEEETHHE
jgi:hypothetical protein